MARVETTAYAAPDPGQAVLVRGRPAVVTDVRSYDGPEGATHFVEVEYLDGWEYPAEDQVIWERERRAQPLTATRLPRVDDLTRGPDDPDRLHAFLDAIRWTSIARLEGLTTSSQELISPWQGAIAVEDYQLYPVYKALEMPRVSLLLADDVGLGKTIEAGLVMTELLVRRRIRRVLVVCPASLQQQWKEEMAEKFSLAFTVMDRAAMLDLQREYGLDTNPWTLVPRVITSMDFLRQPDVSSQFLAGAERLGRDSHLAWDLLVVDEAHNFAPLSFSDRSERTKMLAEISPHFEHRLFLTATPHNGYTASFTGLLELLDPVRFRQTSEIKPSQASQVDLVTVRRLKSQLNERAVRLGKPRPFPKREPKAQPFRWTAEERTLADALRAYRRRGTEHTGQLGGREKRVGRFIFSLLTKRLLSSPYAFARTWWQHVEGLKGTDATFDEVDVARRRAEQQTSDDVEKALREEDAVRRGASWLARHAEALAEPRGQVSDALQALGWGPEVLERDVLETTDFPADGKWEALHVWIEGHIGQPQSLSDERVIVFTEYKGTCDYVLRRLALGGYEAPAVRLLFGGSPSAEREDVKAAFNDPRDPLRVLVATDVASEGLNLQTSCRLVFHYEIPWNPMRLEQRNGRIDRHGQPRDVSAFHFTSDEDEDVDFLDRVVRKVTQVREDLGSVGQVIDATVMEHFSETVIEEQELDRRVEETLKAAPEHHELHADIDDPDLERAHTVFEESSGRLRLSPERLARLVREAAKLQGGELVAQKDGLFRFSPVPPAWQRLVDESVRRMHRSIAGAMPALAFDAQAFVEAVGERTVFRPRPDAVLLRLSHPLVARATADLRRNLFDPDSAMSRWTLTANDDVGDAVAVVSVLLRATNERREIIHTELVEYAFDLKGASVNPPASEGARLEYEHLARWKSVLEDRWDDLAASLNSFLEREKASLTGRIDGLLATTFKREVKSAEKMYDARLQELDREPGDRQRERLRRELERAERQALQLSFDEEENQGRRARVEALQSRLDEAEWQTVREHFIRLRSRIECERAWFIGQVLPQRFRLGRLDLTPVAIKFTVPPEAAP